GYPFEETLVLINMASAAVEVRELEKAGPLAQQARHTAARYEIRIMEHYALSIYAEFLFWKGEWIAAEDFADRTLKFVGSVLGRLQARQGRPEAQVAAGRRGSGFARLERCLHIPLHDAPVGAAAAHEGHVAHALAVGQLRGLSLLSFCCSKNLFSCSGVKNFSGFAKNSGLGFVGKTSPINPTSTTVFVPPITIDPASKAFSASAKLGNPRSRAFCSISFSAKKIFMGKIASPTTFPVATPA
ncbi:MAG: hypothetical protein IH795_06940, partial [Bacteroidetes bacterium]|nr:hypothetical protein [Bacteroidota bacterium]